MKRIPRVLALVASMALFGALSPTPKAPNRSRSPSSSVRSSTRRKPFTDPLEHPVRREQRNARDRSRLVNSEGEMNGVQFGSSTWPGRIAGVQWGGVNNVDAT